MTYPDLSSAKLLSGYGLLLALTTVAAVSGCGADAGGEGEDKLLAEVQQKQLHLSDLDGMFPIDATANDSALIIETFVNRWVRDAVLQYESERNLPADLNVDRLVRDYRASLVRSNYEEVLVSMRLDSTVTEEQLAEYYEENKSQYQLERPIVRCYFLRAPYPTPEEDTLQLLWNNGNVQDRAALSNYAERFAEIALLDETAWYSLDEIADQMPAGTLTADNVDNRREFSQRDGSHRYYFRLFELKPRLEIAPLSYVADQAREVILHNRKLKVLAEARDEIFERELRKNNVDIYTGKD